MTFVSKLVSKWIFSKADAVDTSNYNTSINKMVMLNRLKQFKKLLTFLSLKIFFLYFIITFLSKNFFFFLWIVYICVELLTILTPINQKSLITGNQHGTPFELISGICCIVLAKVSCLTTWHEVWVLGILMNACLCVMFS